MELTSLTYLVVCCMSTYIFLIGQNGHIQFISTFSKLYLIKNIHFKMLLYNKRKFNRFIINFYLSLIRKRFHGQSKKNNVQLKIYRLLLK